MYIHAYTHVCVLSVHECIVCVCVCVRVCVCVYEHVHALCVSGLDQVLCFLTTQTEQIQCTRQPLAGCGAGCLCSRGVSV